MINAKKQEKNRMEKNRDLFKKIRNTKGAFHAKMGTIKDRTSLYLREAEDTEMARIYRRTIQKKIFMTQITRWCDHSHRARHPGM